jgi:polygalacturonase
VYNSKNVTYSGITINTKSYSKNPPANSDGWDVYRSSYVTCVSLFLHSFAGSDRPFPRIKDSTINNVSLVEDLMGLA